MTLTCCIISSLLTSGVIGANRTLTIDEELPVNTTILTVPSTAYLGYTHTSVFSVEGGHLRVVKRLDYERECPQSLNGQVCFFELLLLGLPANYVVKVVVNDINDNAPRFTEVSSIAKGH